MGTATLGTKRHVNLREQADRAAASRVGSTYDSDEFAIGIVANQSLKARGGSKVFVKVPIANHLNLRCDQECTIRLNSATDDPITLDAGVGVDLHFVEFTDIYLTTAAVSTALRVIVA